MPSRKSSLIVALLLTFVPALQSGQDPEAAAVGVPVWMRERVLPGSELEVRPADETTPVIVRIAAASPHGTAFRYDIVYYGLDPGSYDLREFLKRRDGSSLDDLPPMAIEVRSVLGPGQVQPNRPGVGPLPRLGGYRTLWIAAGVLWLVGLWAILRAGRKKRRAETRAASRVPTMADRLRPLVEEARAGTLSRADRAELELTLIAFWRRKLALDDKSVGVALRELKAHAEAGPLLVQLEDWLHRPKAPEDVDIAALLRPYAELPAHELERTPSASSASS